MIKSLEADKIESISVISSPRPLAYLPLRQTLVLQADAVNQPYAITVMNHDPEASVQSNTPVGGATDGNVTIRILPKDSKDGKEVLLRGAKVDRVVKWVNLLSLVRKSNIILV